jgi:hypothetical protein
MEMFKDKGVNPDSKAGERDHKAVNVILLIL